jgi:hypothetical protein
MENSSLVHISIEKGFQTNLIFAGEILIINFYKKTSIFVSKYPWPQFAAMDGSCIYLCGLFWDLETLQGFE